MSKITVCGDAVVITSSLKFSEIQLVEKFRPEALVLVNEDKEPIFAIGTSNGGCGDLGAYGATFGGKTRDENELATITMCGHGITGDIKEYIADTFGGAIANLNKLEAALPAVIEEIKTAKQTVMDAITLQ